MLSPTPRTLVGDGNLPRRRPIFLTVRPRQFRKRSVIGPVATGNITAWGFYGYKLALVLWRALSE